ncbi:MAG: hypothetical protein ACI4O7_13070 [Aristaeellaceae bacterium]
MPDGSGARPGDEKGSGEGVCVLVMAVSGSPPRIVFKAISQLSVAECLRADWLRNVQTIPMVVNDGTACPARITGNLPAMLPVYGM